jgi:hypothetical protein
MTQVLEVNFFKFTKLFGYMWKGLPGTQQLADECTCHSAFSWASIKWTARVKGGQVWLLFKRQPGPSRERGASLPLTLCNLSLEPKQFHMLEAPRKETEGMLNKGC